MNPKFANSPLLAAFRALKQQILKLYFSENVQVLNILQINIL